jgi:hypothetical protein
MSDATTAIERSTQITALLDPPTDQRELGRHYTLFAADLAAIRRCRGDCNRLGRALMLCYLRYPGRPLKAGERPARSLDAAVLDVNLNGQKSYPVADALVARGVPFLFTTGYRRDSVMNGYRSFPQLEKPFKLSELADALAKLLTAREPSTSQR